MSQEALSELKCLRLFTRTLSGLPRDPEGLKAFALAILRNHGFAAEPDLVAIARRRRARGGRAVSFAAAVLGAPASLEDRLAAHLEARQGDASGEERAAAHVVAAVLAVEAATTANDAAAIQAAFGNLCEAKAHLALSRSNVLRQAHRFRGQAKSQERAKGLRTEIVEKRRGSSLNDSAWKARYCAEGVNPLMFEHARNGPAPVKGRTIQEHLTAARKAGALK